MKNYFLLLIIVIGCLSVSGQKNVFYDDFKNNANKWNVTTATVTANYGNDNLLLSNNATSDVQCDGIISSMEFNQNENFTIEASESLKKGGTGNGILWNFRDKDNFCRFLI